MEVAKKILIIGQAPPAVKQSLPYDTTMLYDWLQEIGVSKTQAQELFEFDAVYDLFPGYDTNGSHKKPTYLQFIEYYNRELGDKIKQAHKIWCVGNTAHEYIVHKLMKENIEKSILKTIHPSKRNIGLYNQTKTQLLKSINEFIYF